MADMINVTNGPFAALLEQINGTFLVQFNDVLYDPTGPVNTLSGAAGQTALPVVEGTVFLSDASSGAYTLAAPQSGPPTAVVTTSSNIQGGKTTTYSGQDGMRITIVCKTAHAHVVTVGAGLVNGAASGVVTFAAAIGNSVTLVALGGVWYVVSNIGATIS
jgi:hypothetical protein